MPRIGKAFRGKKIHRIAKQRRVRVHCAERRAFKRFKTRFFQKFARRRFFRFFAVVYNAAGKFRTEF